MITWLLTSSAFLSVLLGIVFQSEVAQLIGLGTIVFSLSRIFIQYKQTAQVLEAWLNDRGNRKEHRFRSYSNLPTLIEMLRYRYNHSAVSDKSHGSGLLPMYRVDEISESENQSDPRFARFRCSTILVARTKILGANNKQIVFEGHGSKGKAFELVLREFVAPFLCDGKDISFGRRDEERADSLFEDFSQFGFAFSVCLPIVGVSEGFSIRQVLWCGYPQGMRPSESEIGMLSQFARELAAELSSKEVLRKLTDRVVHAESGNREKADFIAQMSHDMRSPLYNVKSILNLLHLENVEEERRTLLNAARGNCESLEELIEDILDLTKYQAGKLSAQREVFDLGACLRRVVANFEVAAQVKRLELSVVCPDCTCSVNADRRQIKRILSNLVGNAIKYARVGSIAVELVSTNSSFWRVVIRDSGCGMSEEELSRLFTPFSRFRPEVAEGVGLGLAISKILVDLNGGSIVARSQVGRGSEFEVRFPQWDSDTLPIGRTDRNETISQSYERICLTVLVVDDDVGCVDSLGKWLVQLGCQVLKAYSVGEARELLAAHLPQCVITDANMPEGGGYKLVQFVKVAASSCPVLILSGDERKEQEVVLRNAGADRVFIKPVEPEVLYGWLKMLSRVEISPLPIAIAS